MSTSAHPAKECATETLFETRLPGNPGRLGSDRRTAAVTPVAGYVHVHTRTHREPPLPAPQHTLEGQERWSFCQFHRTGHNQSNDNRQESCVTRAHGARCGRTDSRSSTLPPAPREAPRALPARGRPPHSLVVPSRGPAARRPRVSVSPTAHRAAGILQLRLTRRAQLRSERRRQSQQPHQAATSVERPPALSPMHGGRSFPHSTDRELRSLTHTEP